MVYIHQRTVDRVRYRLHVLAFPHKQYKNKVTFKTKNKMFETKLKIEVKIFLNFSMSLYKIQKNCFSRLYFKRH